MVKIKEPKQNGQNQRASTEWSKSKGLNRMVKIKGPKQNGQNQRA